MLRKDTLSDGSLGSRGLGSAVVRRVQHDGDSFAYRGWRRGRRVRHGTRGRSPGMEGRHLLVAFGMPEVVAASGVAAAHGMAAVSAVGEVFAVAVVSGVVAVLEVRALSGAIAVC